MIAALDGVYTKMTYVKAITKTHIYARRLLLVVLGFVLSCGVAVAEESGFTVIDASTELANKVYRLTASFNYDLSVPVKEALSNGLPIVLELDIEILRPRRFYLWAEDVAALKQQYRIQFHALSKQYLVKNLNSGEQNYFQTLHSALSSLEYVRDLPIIDQSLLNPNEKYLVRLRAGIDLDALPVPLRLFAYFSPSWHLSSDWYSWSL